jgi:hypothetical protein
VIDPDPRSMRKYPPFVRRGDRDLAGASVGGAERGILRANGWARAGEGPVYVFGTSGSDRAGGPGLPVAAAVEPVRICLPKA